MEDGVIAAVLANTAIRVMIIRATGSRGMRVADGVALAPAQAHMALTTGPGATDMDGRPSSRPATGIRLISSNMSPDLAKQRKKYPVRISRAVM